MKQLRPKKKKTDFEEPSKEKEKLNPEPQRSHSPSGVLLAFKRIIIDKKADLSDFLSSIFVGKMCVFVSRPMKIDTFLRKNGDTTK